MVAGVRTILSDGVRNVSVIGREYVVLPGVYVATMESDGVSNVSVMLRPGRHGSMGRHTSQPVISERYVVVPLRM